MDIREKHMQRISRGLLLIHIVTTVFLIVGLIAQLTQSGFAAYKSILPIVVTAVVLAGGIVVYALLNKTEVYAWYLMIAFSVVYAMVLFLPDNNYCYPYMIPFLILFVLTFNAKLVWTSAVLFGGMNLVKVAIGLAGSADINVALPIYMIEGIVAILICVGAVLGVNNIKKFINETVGELASASDENADMYGRITSVAGSTRETVQNAADTLERLRESIENMNTAMSEISQGIIANTEAIAQESDETQEIQGIIASASEKTQHVMSVAEEAQKHVTDGAKSMNDLTHHVSGSIEASSSMKQSALQLQDKSGEVRKITDIIIDISSQTNLLALNASIEAARAGDMGKGFSVVAEEIRDLAEQTKGATENITSILDELVRDAGDVVDRVEESVKIAEEENEYAKSANQKFRNIEDTIRQLASDMDQMFEMMKQITSANNAIVDSISTLSTSSEQITASTEEAARVSETNVKLAEEFAAEMNSISERMEMLK
jgi:methyl-accepting chemotaxis protein